MKLLVSRDEAKVSNNTHYYTGIPCEFGHDSKRYTRSGSCIACDNIKSTEYVKKNKHRILLTKAKNRAKQKNIEFNIDISDVVIPNKCPVLGIDIITNGTTKWTDNSPTIDRIDNDKGYIKGNISVISHKANRLKSSSTIEELKKIVKYMESSSKKKF
jgi:hypothetical protein